MEKPYRHIYGQKHKKNKGMGQKEIDDLLRSSLGYNYKYN